MPKVPQFLKIAESRFEPGQSAPLRYNHTHTFTDTTHTGSHALRQCSHACAHTQAPTQHTPATRYKLQTPRHTLAHNLGPTQLSEVTPSRPRCTHSPATPQTQRRPHGHKHTVPQRHSPHALSLAHPSSHCAQRTITHSPHSPLQFSEAQCQPGTGTDSQGRAHSTPCQGRRPCSLPCRPPPTHTRPLGPLAPLLWLQTR